MYELLEESDLIITKPGGATLFEAIYANTPVIVKSPKVGQEIENAKFIIDKGIGLIYNDARLLLFIHIFILFYVYYPATYW